MIKALVLTGDGINCEAETAFALDQAGASPTILHINRLIESPGQLDQFQILALPGGFSFGDEVNSGKILALKLKYQLGDALDRFIEQDKLVIGICNGFQALVKLGLLPQSEAGKQQVTLTRNRQKRFINRWVWLSPNADTLFFQGMADVMLPIRHGEGRLAVSHGQETVMKETLAAHTALQYREDINGSFERIAGLVNTRGNVLGLMPHPEAFVRRTQHPAWTAIPASPEHAVPTGSRIFTNMVQALR